MEEEIKENNKEKNEIKNKSHQQKINYFKCQECKGYISLNINPHNFSVSYECDKGDKREDLYFASINQFLSANAIEDDLDKICTSCDKLTLEKFLNNEKKGMEYFAYCKGCKKHLCPFCVGNHLTIPKKKHDIAFLGNLIPSNDEITKAKERLNERISLTKKIIEKIDRIKNHFCFISNNIKQILKEEIKFTSNFINNFSPKFPNYQYISNFHTINDYISEIKNEKLNEFVNEKEFKNQINILIGISEDIYITKKELKEKQKFESVKKLSDYQKICENPFGELKYSSFTHVDFCKRDNNFILSHDNNLKFYHLLKNNTIYLDYEYNFKTTINAFILSKNEDEIFLSENGYIYILLFDKNEQKYIKPKDKEKSRYILYNGGKKINQLFLLSDMTLITISDDGKLGVWKRNDEDDINKIKIKNNEKIYNNVKVISSLWSCYEFLEVNETYFIALMRDCNLKFYDCDEVNEIKTLKIKYGDYLREKFNHMVKINNDYVIIGVKNMYVLLSIKFMEIIQYFVLPNIRTVISLYKYDFDNMVLFIGKAADDENVFYQYRFDEEGKILKEISHFENSIEKYGDYRFNFLNNNMIISFYYYYSSSTNKKFELFA